MPADQPPLVLRAGQIVLADWRGDARPREPNKLRPAVVVEDDALFASAYPNTILVPLTTDAALVIPDLSVAITPDAENGCAGMCWAVSHLVTTTSKSRLRPTASRITLQQLSAIRAQIALALGIAGAERLLSSHPTQSASAGPAGSARPTAPDRVP